MNSRINSLVQSVLQKDRLEQCSVVELQKMADAYPYFEVPQLLLTKKLSQIQSVQYPQQLEKTFLYFQNSMWLQHLLNDSGNRADLSPVQFHPSPEIIKEEPGIAIPDRMEEFPIAAPVSETQVESIEELTNTQEELVEPVTDNPPELTKELTGTEENIIEPLTEIQDEVAEEITSAEENLEARVANIKVEESEELGEPEEEISDSVPPLPPLPTFREPIEDNPKKELVFEPFHTVDYFASQGIKLQEEEKPKDKFGQQLRSFTEWLKTMKRLPQTVVEEKIAETSTEGVEQLAEHSLAEREIVTETMAEVWIKQGNTGKAIDIYSKLSLLDPSKSHYFAAKIEELRK